MRNLNDVAETRWNAGGYFLLARTPEQAKTFLCISAEVEYGPFF
jgi:hypothetical protein